VKAAHEKGLVYAAIEAFLIEKVRQFEARLSQMQTLVSEGQLTEEHANEMRRSAEELASIFNEIGSWCGPSFGQLPTKEQNRVIKNVDQLVPPGSFQFSEVVEIVEAAKQKPIGRRAVLRPIALAALEARYEHPERKWKEIIAELCSAQACGNNSHGNCFKNITREITRLRSCLRRYKITIRS